MDSTTFQLTMEQEFQMRLVEQSTQSMSRDQMADLLVQLSRLTMVKDNVIRNLMKQELLDMSH